MIQSGGALVTKAPSETILWQGTTAQLDERALSLMGQSWSYSALYRHQPWIATPVNKIASATARLPLKVYRRTDNGRDEARDTTFGELLRKPSRSVDAFTFWVWVRSILDIYGESFLGKVRDAGGRPVELVRLHPVFMKHDDEKDEWSYDDGKKRVVIQRRDMVHFRFFNPDGVRGLSPLEPLRSTLENEDGARRANSALWRNGGRPSVTLEHPGKLNAATTERLALNWKDIHGGVDNWAKALVLEEGMKANMLSLNVEELQYIEGRKLNREECCAVYDIPPPVLHILDHATYSNITEQMRSMYRDTMGPKLGHIESTLEMELRDGSMGDGEPDFPEDLYAEFLMDEVLRGDFEVRATAYSAGINSGWLQPAEVRQMENKPFVEGSDVLFLNSALQPIERVVEPPAPPPPPAPVVQLEPPEPLALPPAPPKALTVDQVRTVMGRLSRVKDIDDVNVVSLIAGLNGNTENIRRAVRRALYESDTLDDFKALLKEP